jgi:hypothetical protein
MNSVDDILSQRALTTFEEQLRQNLDLQTWTAANRDQKIQNAIAAVDDVSDDSVEYTRRLVEMDIEGKSFLYWKILMQFYSALFEYLVKLREDLDFMDETAMKGVPVTYEWVNQKIRFLAAEIRVIDLRLATALTFFQQADEAQAIQEL